MHTRACTAGLRPKQTCSTTISKSAHLQSIKWCLRSNAQGSSGDSRASLAASRCSSIRNIYRIYTDPASTSQNLRVEVLALQLHSPFEMGAARFGLMGSSPERPCDDVRGLDAPLCKLDDDAADFLDRPADQERRFVRRRSIIFLGGDVILARCRMTAIMAKASMTSET